MDSASVISTVTCTMAVEPNGEIIEQSIPGGTEVKRGTKIELTASDGPDADNPDCGAVA